MHRAVATVVAVSPRTQAYLSVARSLPLSLLMQVACSWFIFVSMTVVSWADMVCD